MGDDPPRSLRFKVTLAPSRTGQTTPPPSSSPALTQPSAHATSQHVIPAVAASHAIATPSPLSNFVLAAERSSQPPLPPPPPLPQQQQQPSLPSAPPHLAPQPAFRPFEASAAVPTDGVPASPPYPQQQQQQRYGGGIRRISELRKQGVEVLLPAMAISTGKTPLPAAARRAQPAEPEHLPADVSFAHIFGATGDGMDPVDRELGLRPPPRRAQRGRGGRGRRAGGGGGGGGDGRTTTGATPSFNVQPDGSPFEHRWYMQGGRRVLVYNGDTYKGKTAHRMWTQIKRATGNTGTRRKKAVEAKKSPRTRTTRQPSLSQRTATAARATARPLTLQYGDASQTPGPGEDAANATTFTAIDLGDTLPQPLRSAPSAAPPRKVPVKQPVRAVVHTTTTPALWQSILPSSTPPSQQQQQQQQQQRQLPLVTRGLASLSFYPSRRARTATARAGGGGVDGSTSLPAPTMQRSAPNATARFATPAGEVVEIADSDDADSGGEEQPTSHTTPSAGKKRERSLSGTGGDGRSDTSSSAEWPHRYFDNNDDTDSSDSDLSSFSSLAPSLGDETVDEAMGNKPSSSAIPERHTAAAPQGSGTRPKMVTIDGHQAVEMDGWCYPTELLPMLSQQAASVAEDTHTRSHVGACHSVLPRLPPAPPLLPDPDASGVIASGITVVGTPSHSAPPRAPATSTMAASAAANAAHVAGPQTNRYADHGVLDALTAEEGMDDLFSIGEELGGFRF